MDSDAQNVTVRSYGLWRRVLSALTSSGVSDAQREEFLALGAAELAWLRAEGRRPVTVQDVQRIAFDEFSAFVDVRQAKAALRERRNAWHGKRERA